MKELKNKTFSGKLKELLQSYAKIKSSVAEKKLKRQEMRRQLMLRSGCIKRVK